MSSSEEASTNGEKVRVLSASATLAGPTVAENRSARWPRAALAQTLRAHWGAILIGLAFLLLSLYYNVTIPLWESDNEWSHYAYTRYLVTNRRLPGPDDRVLMPATGDLCRDNGQAVYQANDQFRQPPLYYGLGALAISWVEVDAELPVRSNPYIFADPGRAGYNTAIHSPAESFPYRGTALAVHVLRLYSGLIGLVGLLAVYLTGLLVFSNQRYPALAMMAVNAFIPQYVFSAAVVNNDILVGALAAWCVYLCIYAILRRGTPLIVMLAAVVAGLAVLAKYTGFPLVLVVMMTLLIRLFQTWRWDREKFASFVWQSGLLVMLAGAPILLWFGRNKVLYDEFIVRYPFLAGSLAQSREWLSAGSNGDRLLDPLRAAEFAFMTFWGLFGTDTIALPGRVLLLVAAACLVALVGVVIYLLDKRASRHMRILTLLALLFVIATWSFSAVKAVGTSEPRGRYLMSVFSTVSFLLVLGLYRLLPGRLKAAGLALLGAFLLLLAAAVPPLLLRPLYAPPALAASAELQPGEQPLHARFGDFAELVGYRVEPARLGVFEKLQVTLVWRAVGETASNYTVGLHLLDGANRPHGSLATFPGRGNFATSLWQEGDVFRDTYELYLEPSAREAVPSLGRVKVSLYCYAPDGSQQLPVKDGQGNAIGDAVYFGRIKLVSEDSAAAPRPAGSPRYLFGDQLALDAFDLVPVSHARKDTTADEKRPATGDQVSFFRADKLQPGRDLTIELRWRALKPPEADYTLFAHLLNSEGELVSGYDQPLTGGYYPSGLWDVGESVVHQHRLPVPAVLPAGQYELFIGLYDPQSGSRLAVRDAQGLEWPDGAARLAILSATTRYQFLPQVQVPGQSSP